MAVENTCNDNRTGGAATTCENLATVTALAFVQTVIVHTGNVTKPRGLCQTRSSWSKAGAKDLPSDSRIRHKTHKPNQHRPQVL